MLFYYLQISMSEKKHAEDTWVPSFCDWGDSNEIKRLVVMLAIFSRSKKWLVKFLWWVTGYTVLYVFLFVMLWVCAFCQYDKIHCMKELCERFIKFQRHVGKMIRWRNEKVRFQFSTTSATHVVGRNWKLIIEMVEALELPSLKLMFQPANWQLEDYCAFRFNNGFRLVTAVFWGCRCSFPPISLVVEALKKQSDQVPSTHDAMLANEGLLEIIPALNM